jgi:hypothetical protein
MRARRLIGIKTEYRLEGSPRGVAPLTAVNPAGRGARTMGP